MNIILPQTTNLKLFQTESFSDDYFKFNENDKFSSGVENTVRKGEIAHDEHFPLFPKCFQRACRHVKTRACLGKGSSHTSFSQGESAAAVLFIHLSIFRK